MFIYSLRASTIKFFAVVTVSLAAIIALIAFVPAYGEGSLPVSGDGKVDYTGIKTNEDRIEFLGSFGWKVDEKPVQTVEVTIPEQFDKIFTGYNEIQKRQGLDLSDYKNKKVTRYTYNVTNYDGEKGEVYANLIVYRNRVIGGDICSG